jgi:hypothetical protein
LFFYTFVKIRFSNFYKSERSRLCEVTNIAGKLVLAAIW